MKLCVMIISLFLTIMVGLTIIGAFYFYIQSNQILETGVSAHLETAAQSRADHIETFLETYYNYISFISELNQIEDILISGQDFDYLNGIILNEIKEGISSKGIYELFITNDKGIIIASPDKEDIGKDKSNYIDLLKGKDKPYIKGAHLSGSGKKAIDIIAPIRNDETGELLGILLAGFKMNDLNKIVIDKTGLGETGEIYLINKDSYMITPSRFKADTFLKQKVDTVNARNCLSTFEEVQIFTIDVTFPLHNSEGNPIAVVGITFFYNMTLNGYKEITFIKTKEKAIKIGENLDSLIYSEEHIGDYDYINQLIYDIIEENPDLKRISIHTKAPEGKSSSGYWIFASSVSEKIGRESDPEDINAINDDEIIILEEASHIKAQELHPEHGSPVLFLDYREVEVIGTHHPILEMQWCLLVEMDETEALGIARNQLLKTAIIWIITISIIISIVGFFIALLISRPIKKLTQNVEDITKGNFSIQLGKSNIFEIQKLTDSLNRILASLKLSILRTGVQKEELGLGEAIRAKEEAESRYKILYESSRDAIMTLEPPTWKFTAGNPATINMFMAKNEEDFTSRAPWEYSPKTQPDRKESGAKAKEMIMKAMKEGSNFFEWTHKRLNGEEFSATVLLTRFKLNGKDILQATIRDKTKEMNNSGSQPIKKPIKTGEKEIIREVVKKEMVKRAMEKQKPAPIKKIAMKKLSIEKQDSAKEKPLKAGGEKYFLKDREVFMEWTKDLSVEVREIDNQHKKLIRIINETYELYSTGKDGDKLNRLVNDLIEFARVHFSTEEKYFKKFNYSGAEEHIREHEKLTKKALEFYKRFTKEGVKIVPDFLEFLKEWVKDHLKKMDQKYVQCFKEHGLS